MRIDVHHHIHAGTTPDRTAQILDQLISMADRQTRMENTLSEITPALDDIDAAVDELVARLDEQPDVTELEALLAAERAAAAALLAAEDAEDVDQNAALADAQAATDAKVGDLVAAAGRIAETASRIRGIAVEPTPDPA